MLSVLPRRLLRPAPPPPPTSLSSCLSLAKRFFIKGSSANRDNPYQLPHQSFRLFPSVDGDKSTMSALDSYRVAVAEVVFNTGAIPASITKQNLLDILEEPRDPKNGDIAVPVPSLKRFAKVDGNPADLAKTIMSKLVFNEDVVSAAAAGPFLNFKINKVTLVNKVLKQIAAEGSAYGFSNEGKNASIIVEFSSPNIAKPFHAGHLRSTIIGNFIANLYKGFGFNVTRINYLGDWGKQYGLLAVGYEKYGSEEKLVADPIQHLFEVYVKINKDADAEQKARDEAVKAGQPADPTPTIHDVARDYFKKMEDGEEKALGLWKRFRDLSITKYKEIYARLNVEFDVYSGESLYGTQMQKELAHMQAKNLLVDDKGALICDMTTKGMGVAIIRKSNGTTLYITRDVAAAHERFEEYKFDKMIYVVAAQQELHFRQLFYMLGEMGYDWSKTCQHVSFGMVKGMSTRKGEVVFLEDILEEARDSMHEVMKKTPEKYALIEDPLAVSDIVGLSAVIIQDMSAKRIKDYAFEWSRMLSFEGDTGPYLQYTHARLMSIERKVGSFNEDADLTPLYNEPAALAVVDVLAKYPQYVKIAFKDFEPSTVVTYAFNLCHVISSAVEALRVIGAEQPVADARLVLFRSARITLGNIIRLVGLKPLERM